MRRLWAASVTRDFIDFPHAHQVFHLERITTDLDGNKLPGRKECRETAFGITSLDLGRAAPDRILALARGHWSIENCLHWVRDVTFDEDRSRVRRGAGAQVMASLRSLAIGLLRLAGAINIAAALRHCAANLHKALRLLGLPAPR